MDLLKTAWRNISRNRRRSTLNVISLTVGIAILIIAVGWIRGYFTTLYTGMMNFDTGQLQVLHEEYLDKEQKLPLDLQVKDYDETVRLIREEKWVREASGRIDFALRIGNGTDTIPALGRAVDPLHEKQITVLDEYLTGGTYLEPGDSGVLLGAGLADKLGVSAGDTVYLRVRDRYNAPNLTAAAVRGIFRLGYPVMDENLVLTGLHASMEFLRTEGGVTRIVIASDGSLSPQQAVEGLNGRLDSPLRAYPWTRFAETLVSAVKADSGSFFFLMVILTILIFLNILNSMSMTVRERGREIGTMRAIGMRKTELKRLLFYESLCISSIALVIGLALAGITAFYLQTVGFDFTEALPRDMPIPFGERFRADYRWYDFAGGALFSIVTAVLGTLIPARRAAKLSVVETMRMSGI